jgi:hypothetical protein
MFQSLVDKNIFSFRIQAGGSSVDSLQITRMQYTTGPLPKIESKDMLNEL